MSQEDLLEAIQSLASTKKRERMVSLEKLENLLRKESVQSILHCNNGSGNISWNVLFIRVHNTILMDLDKANSKSKTVDEKHIQMMQNIILNISQKSIHEGVPLLDCDTLVCSVLSAFESNFRVKFLGSTYTDLLTKYILTYRKFWGEIKLEQWLEMKNICKTCLIQPPPKVQNVVYMDALSNIIRLSCKNVLISQDLLDVFSVVTNIVSSHKHLCLTFPVSLLRLINILCLQLAIEFRYVVCSFMEDIFDFVMSLYDKKKSSKNHFIFHFLIIYLNIHNPNGVSETDESFYAFDERKWRQHMITIFSLTQETVKMLPKNSAKTELEVGFMDLFVDINYLAFTCGFNRFLSFNADAENEGYSENRTLSNKRKRSSDYSQETQISSWSSCARSKQVKLDCNLCTIIEDFQSSDAWFWLEFLEMLLQKFPQVLYMQYKHFVKVLSKLLHDCRDLKKAQAVCRCLYIILSKTQHSLTSSTKNEEQLNDVWNKVGLELIRLFELEETPEYHRLMRSLIINSKFLNPVPLLNLYLKGVIGRNNESLSTLLTMCQNCILPESMTGFELENGKGRGHIRLFLLKWLFQERVRLPTKELSKMLITLILTRSEEDIEISSTKNSETIVTSRNINDLLKLIMSNYETVSMKNLKFVEGVKLNDASLTPKIDLRMQSELFDILEVRRSQLCNELLRDECSIDGRVDTVRDALHYCELLCNLHTFVKNFNLVVRDWDDLLEKMKNLLFLTTNKTYELIKNRFFNLAPFVTIYSSDYSKEMCKLIRDNNTTNMAFLKYLFKVFKERVNGLSNDLKSKKEELKSECDGELKLNSSFSNMINNPRSVLHLKSLNEEERKIVEAVEVLCHFIISPGFSEQNRFQKTLEGKLLEDLINDNALNLNSNFHLQIVFRVIYNFSQFDGIGVDALKKNLRLLTLVFESKKFDSEISVVILQIMKEFVNLIRGTDDKVCQLNFLTLINGYRNLINNKRRCGITVVLKYLELLVEIMRMELMENFLSAVNTCKTEEFCREIILFLKHPCYEVRLFAAQHVGKLFVLPEKNVQTVFESQRMLINLLRNTLLDGNDVTEENSIGLLVSPYYETMGVSVSLISWASVICLSSYWRRFALFHLLQLECNTHHRKGRISTALDVICKEFRIKNSEQFISSHLPYLVQKWVEANYEVEEFPFYVLGYQKIEEFLENHSNILLPVYFWSGRFDMATRIAEKLNKTVKKVVKDCFPELMAVILFNLSGKVKNERVQNAENLRNFMEKELGLVSSELLVNNLEIIIFRMFYFMEDGNYLKSLVRFRGNLFEECRLLSFKLPQIEEALGNAIPEERQTPLIELALNQPHVIQKVLLLLSGEVERAFIIDDRMLSLHKYIAFVDILSTRTKTRPHRNIVAFVVRDVVHALGSFMSSWKDEKITEMALKCLNKLLRNYIHEYSSVLCDFLSVITVLCKPLIQAGNKEALEILKFLICDNFSKLSSAIANLDSFPNEQVFQEMNRMLEGNKSQWRNVEDTMKHFLDVSGKKRCAIEGLEHLRNVLTDGKEELRLMCENLKELKGFSEDCSKSLLHRTICALIELTTAKNHHVRVEAAKCLGELGPLDLATLVLKPENQYFERKQYKSSLYRLLKLCIKDLSNLIIHEHFEYKMAASELLYITVGTYHGSEILKEEDPKMRSYLLPFSSATQKILTVSTRGVQCGNNLDKSSLWTPGESHEDWIQNLVAELLKSLSDNCCLLERMVKMAEINWNFAERMCPAVLDMILSFGGDEVVGIINRNIGAFFCECFNRSRKSGLKLNLRSLQCMVNVVDYIRIQRNFEGACDELELKLNYIHVAEAARCCSAFFTSILYVELWFNDRKKLKDNLTIDNVCELYPDEGFTLTEILRDCYSKIGIFDGVHGCGYMHLLDFSTESQHYEQLNKWNISMLYHDVEISQGSANSERRLLDSLHQFGMLYSVNSLIQQGSNKEELSDLQYKCASALSDWNLFDNVRSSNTFEKSRYFSLKAFHDDDRSAFHNEINKARRCTISKLSSCSLESVENLYHLLSELRCLKELEDFESGVSSLKELEYLYHKWCQQDRIECSDFKLIENILTQRVIAIKEEFQRNKDPDVKGFLHEMLCQTYYKLLKSARKEKRYETAIRSLSCLSRLDNLSETILGKMKMEKSFLEWEIGDKNVSKYLLYHYLQQNEIKGHLRAKALRIYGDWMATTNSENSRHIIEEYYVKSIEISKAGKERVNSYASLAKFADSNYEQMKDYLTSPLFEMKKNLINRQQDLASELRQEIGWNENREKKIACHLVERQSIIDEKEIKCSENEMDFFLSLAVRYYLLSLNEGEKYDFLVFRLISLWFSNPDSETVLVQLKKYLDEIPSHKFLCLLPQILPRMDEIGLISGLTERILQDHPYHTLPVLFAVANSFEDGKYGNSRPVSHSQRSLVARGMLEKFQKDNRLKDMITETDQFCDAMIELANTAPVDRKTAKSGTILEIPSSLKISRLKNLHFVPVPSVTIPSQKTCNYENIPGIKCFESRYQLVGGINVPKKVTCIGLDGISRSLLIKGRDDLRQDAVMQQVFTVINSLLHRDPETNRRKLVIRTYRVVPLSHRSGIIEWCENTQPLSLYLVGPDGVSGAHKKFNPGDLTASECRSRLMQASGVVDATNESKLQAYLDICGRFRPAFRHFFFENFPEPGVWFERRLAYTHSVATSSMIGYVLGIGDRHVHNILIDNATAEVIHIDLGIAFEQGKTLRTPETVPFRLTRDIVDGMGISGVEGVFRLSCVKTMQVLRENCHTILTLLEVLLYDPLYAWAITAEKAFSVQGHAGTESSSEKDSSHIGINKMAERALIRLKQKLQGIETGGVATNAEGQVGYLIQQARDPNNLCRLFHGWQPYL